MSFHNFERAFTDVPMAPAFDAQSGQIKCPGCPAMNPSYKPFCGNCGNKL